MPGTETNTSFLVLHPSSGVHNVKTVGRHLKYDKTKIAKKTNRKAQSFFFSSTVLKYDFRACPYKHVYYSTTQVKGKRKKYSYSFLKKQNRTK